MGSDAETAKKNIKTISDTNRPTDLTDGVANTRRKIFLSKKLFLYCKTFDMEKISFYSAKKIVTVNFNDMIDFPKVFTFFFLCFFSSISFTLKLR